MRTDVNGQDVLELGGICEQQHPKEWSPSPIPAPRAYTCSGEREHPAEVTGLAEAPAGCSSPWWPTCAPILR